MEKLVDPKGSDDRKPKEWTFPLLDYQCPHKKLDRMIKISLRYKLGVSGYTSTFAING
jgi:hypothetical protein